MNQVILKLIKPKIMTFTPSKKQQEAIEKMEDFCLIKSHRTIFKTKQEFDNYFVLLQAKWKKRAKLLNDIFTWKTSFEQIKQKKIEKKEKFYSNESNLKNYAIKYINRYFPTIKQLKLHLSKKNKDNIIVKNVVLNLKHLINEEKLIDSFIYNLKNRWKNINYIKTKLYNKWFDWNLIKKNLNKLNSGESLLIQYNLESKIKYYKNKWKSRFQISSMFIERNEDRELVENILEKIFWENWEKEILKNNIESLKRKKIEQRKIISRLLSKWFKYQDILELI